MTLLTLLLLLALLRRLPVCQRGLKLFGILFGRPACHAELLVLAPGQYRIARAAETLRRRRTKIWRVGKAWEKELLVIAIPAPELAGFDCVLFKQPVIFSPARVPDGRG